MKLGVRGKLFWLSCIVIGVVGLTSGVFLEGRLRSWLTQQVEADLLRHARSARGVIELRPEVLDSIETADRHADALGGGGGVRVTIIAADGRVLGDSALSPAEVAALQRHDQRPEVRAARRWGQGTAQRLSATLDQEMLYVAVPLEGGGVVRAAMPLTQVGETIGTLRVTLLVAGLLGLVVALFMSGLASHYLSRTLRTLVQRARTMASPGGDGNQEITDEDSDEIDTLASSLTVMGEEIHRLVHEVASERNRFEGVLEGMGEAVLAVDRDGNVTLVNASARLLLTDDRAAIDEILADAVEPLPGSGRIRQDPTSFEFELPGPPRRQMLARVSPQPDGGLVVVLHDVTQLRRLETIRRDFVANVSHELRTPISVIQANAETLLDGALDEPERAREFVEALLRNAERLSRIIADLLDLSRIEAGRYPLDIQPTDLVPAADRAVDAVSAPATEKRIEIEVALGSGEWVLADTNALEQVLVNLLDNAVKYTPAGGRVQVRAVPVGDRLRVEVCDNGPGIPEKHRARVFERFYRADPGRSRYMGGTGLGLAIVKHLVSAVGGAVGVEAAEPHGSVFWFTLRRHAASPRRDAEADLDEAASRSPRTRLSGRLDSSA